MGLAESFEFLVILEDNHFARVATQHDGILESLSKVQITP